MGTWRRNAEIRYAYANGRNERPSQDEPAFLNRVHERKDMGGSIEERIALAEDLQMEGYNCAQCVTLAASDLTESERELLFRANEGFGNGMGGLSETCGAISGGIIALGLATCAGPDDRDSRRKTRKLAEELVNRFREKNGATLCIELKGGESGEPLRLCSGCIEDAVRITCELLQRESQAGR